MHILYINFDGILQPLGYSQVLRPLLALSERGFKFTLLTLERTDDLADKAKLHSVRSKFDAADVRWIQLPYKTTGRAIDAVSNLGRALLTALQLVAFGHIDLIHARSYHGGLLAYLIHLVLRTPYIFDARGYWIDERLEDGRWFGNPAVLGVGRLLERELYRRSAAMVSLTQIAADDVRAGRFGEWPDEKPAVVIPTCVDYEDFSAGASGAPPQMETPSGDDLAHKLVVGYIGSINASYRVVESIQLFDRVRRLRDDAHLLCLTRQEEQMRQLLDDHAIPREAYTVTSASHSEMPQWLNIIDWGLLLLNETEAKRASMPTKLGEFFAASVRPVQFGCNREVSNWVGRSGSGYVLESISDRDLDTAARHIAASRKIRDVDEELLHARQITQQHFSLRSGIDGYESLYRRLVG